MSDVWSNLSVAGFGAAVGFIGALIATNRSIRANWKRDNFLIAKDSLETQIRSLSRLEQACDSYLRSGYFPGDPKRISLVMRELVIGICNVLAETPWAFSGEIREQQTQLKRHLSVVEAVFNDEVRPLLGQDLPSACHNAHEAAHALHTVVDSVASSAKNELKRLLDERNILMEKGIPK
jgi:hypothetical protein